MNLSELLAFIGKTNIPFSSIVDILSGNPVSIPVQPLTEPLAGKTLTIALAANAVTIQFK